MFPYDQKKQNFFKNPNFFGFFGFFKKSPNPGSFLDGQGGCCGRDPHNVAKIPQTYVFLLVQRASSLLLQRVFHTRASHPACMSGSF